MGLLEMGQDSMETVWVLDKGALCQRASQGCTRVSSEALCLWLAIGGQVHPEARLLLKGSRSCSWQKPIGPKSERQLVKLMSPSSTAAL